MSYIPFDVAPADPRFGNAARDTLLSILQVLYIPNNYKVILTVDRVTEKLQLKVLKRTIHEVKVFNRYTIWRSIQDWDNPECIQRTIEGRNYEAIVEQLKADPHFLEFEFSITGASEAKQITIF